MTTDSVSRRSYWRFRLRSVVILITLVGGLFAWIAKERRQSVVERQLGDTFVTPFYLGPYDSIALREKGLPQGWWRDVTRRILGERIQQVVDWRDGKASDLAQLRQFTKLRRLQLNSSLLTTLDPFAELTSLEELRLGLCSASDLSPIAGLVNLKRLGVDSPRVTDLSPLVGLRRLERLDFGYTSVADLTPLADLASLKRIDLSHTAVSDLRPLARLENLEDLDVSFTSVSDLAPLRNLKHLKWLSVQSTPVAEEQLQAIRQALPNCRINR